MDSVELAFEVATACEHTEISRKQRVIAWLTGSLPAISNRNSWRMMKKGKHLETVGEQISLAGEVEETSPWMRLPS